MSTVTKLAAIREPGYPIGEAAPCWFTCPCGAKHRAFQESIACACGARWTADGYRRAPLSADPVALVDHVISLMEGAPPMATPQPTPPPPPGRPFSQGEWEIEHVMWLQDDRIYADDDESIDAESGAEYLVMVGTPVENVALCYGDENANLIAAAPKLLALLDRVQAYCPVAVQAEIRALIRAAKEGGS